MNRVELQDLAVRGMVIGAGVTLIPVVATSLIACSKVILFGLIVDVAMRILKLDYLVLHYRPGYVQVPMLWSFSYYSAIAGSSLFAISLVAYGALKLYESVKG